MSTDIVFKNISHERAMWAADCREQHFRQVDGTNTNSSCGKWEIEIQRGQIQGERGEKPKVKTKSNKCSMRKREKDK